MLGNISIDWKHLIFEQHTGQQRCVRLSRQYDCYTQCWLGMDSEKKERNLLTQLNREQFLSLVQNLVCIVKKKMQVIIAMSKSIRKNGVIPIR